VRGLALAGAAAVALLAFGYLSHTLPAPPVDADIMLSVTFGVALVALFVRGLLPLRDRGGWLLLGFVAGIGGSIVLTYLGAVPLANVAKLVGAASFGFWIAAQVENVTIVVVIALLIPAVDIFSVFFGPTKAILEGEPSRVGYFVVAFTWLGYTFEEAYSALGISDVFFYALFLACARGFGLRVGWSAVVMAASFVVTVAFALWWRALPALPLLSLGFLAVNADLLVAAVRRERAARREGQGTPV